MPTKLSSRQQSSKKLLKKGGTGGPTNIDNIIIQETIVVNDKTMLYSQIYTILNKSANNKGMYNVNKIINFLQFLSRGVGKQIPTPEDPEKKIFNNYEIFEDIADTVIKRIKDISINFTSKRFSNNNTDIFGKYQLWNREDKRKFITIDPTIIQIMIFDDKDEKDVVYSLKLIIKAPNKLTLRYTTKLFPKDEAKNLISEIQVFNDLTNFINFNNNLHEEINMDQVVTPSVRNPSLAEIENNDRKKKATDELMTFIKKYLKFYKFYKKCYTFENKYDVSAKKDESKSVNEEVSKQTKIITKTITDYQLKYISILGKARFWNNEIKLRTESITDYVMANLIFASPTYGFISGGYKGFKDNVYGITRSGYEIAKKYNRPILTIMCKEGTHDSHEYSDAKWVYGEHWGEDTLALSQFTDGAIIIAPFGGWTYVECLALLAQKKIVGIYNDFFNILKYESRATHLNGSIAEKNARNFSNKNFFNFNDSERKSIIDYYINYYLILLYLVTKSTDIYDKNNFIICLEYGITILSHMKNLFEQEANNFNNFEKHMEKQQLTYKKAEISKTIQKIREEEGDSPCKSSENKIKEFEAEIMKITKKLNEIEIKINEYADDTSIKVYDINNPFSEYFVTLITTSQALIKSIYDHINNNGNYKAINKVYKNYCPDGDTYQDKIPQNCIGIWIKPVFSLIDLCIKYVSPVPVPVAAPASLAGGSKKKRGGKCNETLLNSIPGGYTIDIKPLNNNMFFNSNKINNNIIFVFSDVMFLNLHLNEKLNSSDFQKSLQNKIDNLELYTPPNIGNSSFSSTKVLLEDEQASLVSLDRSIDGMLGEDGNKIDDHIIKESYSFVINSNCNTYEVIYEDVKTDTPEATEEAAE